MAECVFKDLKLIKDDDINKQAALNFIESNTKDPIWKPVYKSSLEICFKEINEKMPDILKELQAEPFNIKRNQCNVKYMSIVTCIHLEGFIVNILNRIELTKQFDHFFTNF